MIIAVRTSRPLTSRVVSAIAHAAGMITTPGCTFDRMCASWSSSSTECDRVPFASTAAATGTRSREPMSVASAGPPCACAYSPMICPAGVAEPASATPKKSSVESSAWRTNSTGISSGWIATENSASRSAYVAVFVGACSDSMSGSLAVNRRETARAQRRALARFTADDQARGEAAPSRIVVVVDATDHLAGRVQTGDRMVALVHHLAGRIHAETAERERDRRADG